MGKERNQGRMWSQLESSVSLDCSRAGNSQLVPPCGKEGCSFVPPCQSVTWAEDGAGGVGKLSVEVVSIPLRVVL